MIPGLGDWTPDKFDHSTYYDIPPEVRRILDEGRAALFFVGIVDAEFPTVHDRVQKWLQAYADSPNPESAVERARTLIRSCDENLARIRKAKP